MIGMVFKFLVIFLHQLAPFDPTKKKKKKKVVIQDPVEDSTESQTDKSDSLPGMMKVYLLCETSLFLFSGVYVYFV